MCFRSHVTDSTPTRRLDADLRFRQVRLNLGILRCPFRRTTPFLSLRSAKT
jgi:hypothetical protein